MVRIRQGPIPKYENKEDPPRIYPNFSTNGILTERSTAYVRSTASFLSVDFALLGHVDIAASIQTRLHNRDYIPEGMSDGARNFWPSLGFAYEAAGIRGPGMKDKPELDKMQKEEIEWIEGQCFMGTANWDDEEKRRKQERAEEALKAVFEKGIYNVPEEEAVQVLQDYTEMESLYSFGGRAARTRLIDFLVEKGQVERARGLWAECVEAMHQSISQMLYDWMPRTRNAWRVIVDGSVAKKLGLDKDAVAEKGREALEVIERRLRDGPNRRPLADKTDTELVQIIEQKIKRTNYPGFTNLLEPGASEEVLSATEKELGLSLPSDYKTFLRLGNGFIMHPFPREVDVISGTSTLKWQPPLTEVFKLTLLPNPEACQMPNIEETSLDRVLELRVGDTDREEVYLVEPRLIEKARRELMRYYNEDAEDWMKRNMDLAFNNFFGGKEEFEKIDWGVMIFSNGGVDWSFKPSFRAYLEDVTARVQTLDLTEYL